eukprot:scaffold56_cov390-Pavlova_lutheri.AAC.15
MARRSIFTLLRRLPCRPKKIEIPCPAQGFAWRASAGPSSETDDPTADPSMRSMSANPLLDD